MSTLWSNNLTILFLCVCDYWVWITNTLINLFQWAQYYQKWDQHFIGYIDLFICGCDTSLPSDKHATNGCNDGKLIVTITKWNITRRGEIFCANTSIYYVFFSEIIKRANRKTKGSSNCPHKRYFIHQAKWPSTYMTIELVSDAQNHIFYMYIYNENKKKEKKKA